jgi:multicomponent Na+:H+ antiporter subunit D
VRDHLPVLIVIIPLIFSMLILLVGYFSSRLARWVVVLTTLMTHIVAIFLFLRVLKEGTWHYHFGGWQPPWGIEFAVDPVSAVMALMITFLFFLVAVYNIPFLQQLDGLKNSAYHSLFFLLAAGLTGIVVTADLFNVFVFMEISALATYVLVSFNGGRASLAAFRYLIIGTIGAKFYLLAVWYFYAITGTLNFFDLSTRLAPMMDSPPVLMAIALLVTGLGIKMALFPMHGWLPDAYTYAPAPISAIISGVMTKVPAFVLFKLFYNIIGVMEGPVPLALTVIGALAAAGMLAGSVMAITQREGKRLLAYSSVAQIGFIMLGISMGNILGLVGSLLHILNHSLMKCCLFFIMGALKWRNNTDDLNQFKGLSAKMPITMAAFTVAALSMVGLPPTAGFFSKLYLVKGAVDSGIWIYVPVLLVSSLLSGVYFFRIIENGYLGQSQFQEKGHGEKETDSYLPAGHEVAVGNEDEKEELVRRELATYPPVHRYLYDGGKGLLRRELPVTMLIPIIVLAVIVLLFGFFNEPIVSRIISPFAVWRELR